MAVQGLVACQRSEVGVSVAVLLLGGLGAVACGCHDSTCGSSESATFTLVMAPSELSEGTLTACRNDECYAASLAPLGQAPSTGSLLLPLDQAVQSDEVALLEVWAEVETDLVGFRLVWHLASAETLQRGDALSATIETPGDIEVFSAVSEVSSFTTSSNSCVTARCRNAQVNLDAE